MSAQTPLSDDDRALAGEYVLGLLGEAEVEAFEARLLTDPALRDLVAEWAEAVVPMADGEDVPPPGTTWLNIEQTLFGNEAKSVPFWRKLGIGQAVFGAMAAAGLAFVVINGGLLQPDVPPRSQAPVMRADLAAQIAAEDASLVVAALYDSRTGEMRLNAVAGEMPTARARELWVIAGNSAPQSLGLLEVSGATVLYVPDALRGQMAGALLAISDEPFGGSPTGAPTGAVLATGPVTAL